MGNDKLTMTVKQLAERLQVSLPTAYSMVNRVGFPSIHAGKKILIPVAQLERWLEEQATGAR